MAGRPRDRPRRSPMRASSVAAEQEAEAGVLAARARVRAREALRAAIADETARQMAAIVPLPPNVARHEGGHTALGWIVGDMPLVAVEIGRESGRLGRVLHVGLLAGAAGDATELRRRCVRACISLWGGLEADLHMGRPEWSGSRVDRELIDVASEAFAGDERARRAEADRLRRVSRGLVAEAWPLIEGLAQLLDAKRRLTGAEVDAFLAGQPLAVDLRLLYTSRWPTSGVSG